MTLGGRTYEVLSFLREGEDYLMGSQLVVRVKEMKANVGQDDGEHLLKHQDEIPLELREKTFVFTDWCIPEDGVIIFVLWNGRRWESLASLLGVDWDEENHVLRRKSKS